MPCCKKVCDKQKRGISGDGTEVDVIVEQGTVLMPIEIKAGKTVASCWRRRKRADFDLRRQ